MRFFAFYESYQTYKGKLAAFLNAYMNKYKNPNDGKIKWFKELFMNTLTIANKLNRRFDSKNLAEAILIGIAYNINFLENKNNGELENICEKLLKQPIFTYEEMKEGLGSEEKVKNRITTAINAFNCG